MKKKISKDFPEDNMLEIKGARVHNLRNIDVNIPRDKLVVITGLSGSGKSSLAFDTIYAEGQRRYMETFSAYARQFIGHLERPDVDQINGLSPVISIEQKSVNRNPRSTVGTITEIYDFLRLLFARASEAYSYNTGEKMVQYTEAQIVSLISEKYHDRDIALLAPLVRGRKGHYRELFERIRQQGFLRVRVDGDIRELAFGMQLDRYKVHDIEAVVDRFPVTQDIENRLKKSLETAMRLGKGVVMVLDETNDNVRHYSKKMMCPTTGIAYDEPEPNLFSFNSPYGACPRCNGLGVVNDIDLEKVFPDKNLSIKKGGIAPLGEYKNTWVFNQIETIGLKYGFTLNTLIGDIPAKAMDVILHGSNETVEVKKEYLGITSSYSLTYEGLLSYIASSNAEGASQMSKKWSGRFMNKHGCPECGGSRLKKQALYFKIDGKNISELAGMDLNELKGWLTGLEDRLNEKQQRIAREILREIRVRLNFLLEVGIDYVSLNRPARTLSGGESQRIRLATQIGSRLTGVMYIGLGFTGALLIRKLPDGEKLFLLICFATWGADIGAYYAGRLWGKRKLAPRISPGKTVEGFIGGVVSASVFSAAFGYLFYPGSLGIPAAAAALCGGLIGPIGDLSESSIKRYFGVKDSGTLLPGHGGLLDRADALMMSAPVFYIFLAVKGGLV